MNPQNPVVVLADPAKPHLPVRLFVATRPSSSRPFTRVVLAAVDPAGQPCPFSPTFKLSHN